MTTPEEIALLRAQVAHLTRQRNDLVSALEEAQDHIIDQLQPEFAILSQRQVAQNQGRDCSNRWDDETYWNRLATWWHGVGTQELIDKVRDEQKGYTNKY